MAKVKRARPSKRFGPRYGARAKKKIDEIERVQRASYKCPSCGAEAVKRVAVGIWQCRKCGYKFASGAFRVV
ncbi:MAG: 50S ribosomal protein L37ae [Candidatus Altiarchaeota archaeon]|nr:50S ribosomal protein L37ae [Candidatus Altiarchaeota archaeon]